MARRQRDVETEVEQRDRDRGTKRAAVRRQGIETQERRQGREKEKETEVSTRGEPHAEPPLFHWEGEGLGMAGEVP